MVHPYLLEDRFAPGLNIVHNPRARLISEIMDCSVHDRAIVPHNNIVVEPAVAITEV